MFFSCPERGSVSTFRKEGFLRLCMQRCCKEGNLETRRAQPARYMDVAGFLFGKNIFRDVFAAFLSPAALLLLKSGFFK